MLAAAAAAGALFFDDFGHADPVALRAAGWTLREKSGHPGVPGASWAPGGITLEDDPQRRGNRVLTLTASTTGDPAGTQQAQLCHARKYLYGTYAARVRFSDRPVQGADGDPVIQAFYAVGPLAHDLDPQFSEVDWEYLPNGGWGSAATRLFAISWQTAQIEPWRAFNSARELPGSHEGWRVLVMQVDARRVRHFLDGKLVAEHRGRNVPVTPMSINASLWFSPGGLLAAGPQARVWQQRLDWVLHVRDRQLSPQAVVRTVAGLRRAGVAWRDTVPAAADAASPCDL